MSTETTTTNETVFDDGSKIIEMTTTESEYVESAESIAATEAFIEEVAAAAPAEEVADAVAIAEIEANRDIVIAEIQAETQTAAIEAVETESDDKWLTLSNQVQSLSSQVAILTATLSIPPASEEAPPSQNNQSESESQEVTPDNLEAERAPEPPKRPKKLRWI